MSWKGLPLSECKISYFIDVFTDRLKEIQKQIFRLSQKHFL